MVSLQKMKMYPSGLILCINIFNTNIIHFFISAGGGNRAMHVIVINKYVKNIP